MQIQDLKAMLNSRNNCAQQLKKKRKKDWSDIRDREGVGSKDGEENCQSHV